MQATEGGDEMRSGLRASSCLFCLLCEQVGDQWAVYGCGCSNVRRNVRFGEREVSMRRTLLLEIERD